MEEDTGKCQECGEVDILDTSLRICFQCWCVLDLKEQENSSEPDVELDELEQNPYDMG